MHPRTHFKEREKTDDYSDYEVKLANIFAKRLDKELEDFLHCAILFGSTARSAHTTIYEKDIDVLVIVNDMVKILNPEVIEAYRIIVHNTAKALSKRFHINTMKLSDFWEYVRNGDPLILNILTDGRSLLDKGLFETVQNLHKKGLIRPTKENVWVYFMRGPSTITNAKWHVLQAALDLYWAVLDASHAILISQGEAPLSPKHIAKLMREYAKKGKIKKHHANTVEEFYDLSMAIVTREVKDMSGAEYDRWKVKAEGFIHEVLPRVKEKKQI